MPQSTRGTQAALVRPTAAAAAALAAPAAPAALLYPCPCPCPYPRLCPCPADRRPTQSSVFNQDTKEVVGVAFATNSKAEATGFIIPVPVIDNFLRVYAATGDFGLLPALGVRIRPVKTT